MPGIDLLLEFTAEVAGCRDEILKLKINQVSYFAMCSYSDLLLFILFTCLNMTEMASAHCSGVE